MYVFTQEKINQHLIWIYKRPVLFRSTLVLIRVIQAWLESILRSADQNRYFCGHVGVKSKSTKKYNIFVLFADNLKSFFIITLGVTAAAQNPALLSHLIHLLINLSCPANPDSYP